MSYSTKLLRVCGCCCAQARALMRTLWCHQHVPMWQPSTSWLPGGPSSSSRSRGWWVLTQQQQHPSRTLRQARRVQRLARVQAGWWQLGPCAPSPDQAFRWLLWLTGVSDLHMADLCILLAGWMDGWVDGWMDGWMVGWLAGRQALSRISVWVVSVLHNNLGQTSSGPPGLLNSFIVCTACVSGCVSCGCSRMRGPLSR